ncbi:MAG: tyrosine-protein phosphatase [Acutalibacteraceae bacterium]
MNNEFIDIHSHVLWNIDDGSRSFYETLDLCAMAEDVGTKILFLTPHLMYWDRAEDLFDQRNEKAEKLRQVLLQEGIDLKLELGFEILCDDDIFNVKYFKPYTLCGSRYILIEFDFFKTSEEDVTAWCNYLISNGLVPIIAHPERYEFVLDDFSVFQRLSDKGVLFQMNGCSAEGAFGAEVENTALRMLEYGFVDFVGSDAHNINRRNTELSRCFEEFESKLIDDFFDIVCWNNPQCVIKNEQIIPRRISYFNEK